MITTVTSATASSVTTLAVGATLGLAAVIALIALLVVREVLAPVPGERSRAFGSMAWVAIVPLAIVFVGIVGTKVAEAF